MSRSFLDISFRPPEETDAVDFSTPSKQPNTNNNNNNSQQKPASNGPLSPFSPILQRLRRKPDPIDDDDSEKDEQSSSAAPDTTALSQQQQQQRDSIETTKEHFLMSLAPCRKVSVVVCVDNNGAEKKRKKKRDVCLFPLDSSQSQSNTTTTAASAATHPSSSRDIVVVNPKAFGTVIPSSITMETSRVVAQIANIPSEDWTRTYRFQHVVWDPQHDETLLSGRARCQCHQEHCTTHLSLYGASTENTNTLWTSLAPRIIIHTRQ